MEASYKGGFVLGPDGCKSGLHHLQVRCDLAALGPIGGTPVRISDRSPQ
nr:hypothetical protein RP007_03718 [Rhizobium sp. P007]